MALMLLFASCSTPSAVPDAAVPPDLVPCNSFLDNGYCFQHTIPCQTDSDCPAPYFGCYLNHCRTWQSLDCLYGGDCGPNKVCLKNDRAQGCFPIKPHCTTAADCSPGDICKSSLCQEPCCGGVENSTF